MAAVTALPVPLSGRFKGSFAYFTIKDRLPQILTRTIDTLHRHKNEFFEEHGEKGVEAEKRAISFLSKLRNELQTDKPVTPLEDELPDATLWNQYLDYQRNLSNGNGGPSWFQSPWLYVECYMYRRIHAALAQNPPIDNFDVFKEGKAQNFFESQGAIIALCTYFQELLKNIKDLDEKQLQEEFFKLLQVSLWGNKCDLSFSAGEDSSQKSSPLQCLEDMMQSHLFLTERKMKDDTALTAACSSRGNKGRMEPTKEPYDHFLLDIPVTREQMNRYRAAAETAQSELAALSVKYDCAQSELLQLRSRMVSKEAFFQELKAEAESYKENNARQASLLLSLQTRVRETEEESSVLATSKKQAELTAQAAFKENCELKEKLHEQNAKLNKYLNECEESKAQAFKISRKYEELLSQLSEFLDTDIREKEKPQEHLMSKVCEICKENLALKGQVAALQETINGHEMESKASRETIMRLVSEANKEQKKAAGYYQDMEKLSKMVSQFETQIAKLTESLENQTRLYQEALERNRKAEKQSETFQDQLKHLEEELLSIDMMQDGLKLEKQKYLIFLEQLNEKMRLDSVAAEVGFDMTVNAILARVEQLVKLEGDAVIENKTMAYSLRRKLKTQKEKLESKELHVNLLQQKITQLEEEKQVRTALAVERDEANLTVRKLHKVVERLQKQLDLARETNTDLKAKLSETNELKIQTLEQNRTIEELNKSQGKLERMKEKVEKQLNSVKSELHLKELKATEDKEKAKNMLEAVSSEMKVLKTTLAELTRRERQLADFREVVSRMLGLDIASLALPDYEIITCLEGLIHCHQHHFITCVCLKDVARTQDEHTISSLKHTF
ncbi:coiled-coil domain-containing protein 170-like isoform X2 [Cygnus atratus]|uniref:coiled-coil domain-containing protein 170-like isoform X2 n=1 Tax=Cygnus atratus TaxID=8868 RepID=UPI0015D5B27B|nr:coiled-coil domain-containing protein 170-like isoform X2 [Cygnus atratus]